MSDTKRCQICLFNETPAEEKCSCMVRYNKKIDYIIPQTTVCDSYETNKKNCLISQSKAGLNSPLILSEKGQG